MAKSQRRATDHRATVLEAVATFPGSPTGEDIVKDCATASYTPKMVRTMLDALVRFGLIRRSDQKTFSITAVGLEYLTLARFDRAIGEFAPRPKARRKK
jgi:Fe2+ or Zn2+ uptake regulation protein